MRFVKASLPTDSVACSLGFVGAIMPEGIGSGKAPKTTPTRVFPQSGMRHFMRT
jgi:hypothetical protein